MKFLNWVEYRLLIQVLKDDLGDLPNMCVSEQSSCNYTTISIFIQLYLLPFSVKIEL